MLLDIKATLLQYAIVLILFLGSITFVLIKNNTKKKLRIGSIDPDGEKKFVDFLLKKATTSNIPKTRSAVEQFYIQNQDSLKLEFIFKTKITLLHNPNETLENLITKYVV